MSRNIHYILVENDGEANITAYVPGVEPFQAHSSHPNFERIKVGLLNDDPAVIDLFDLSTTVADRFEELSERVSVANGRVYFDGDEVDSTITRQIVRFFENDVPNWKSLVNFMENVAQNPDEHSREQLFDWLRDRDFAINACGDFIAYKGVRKTHDDSLVSVNHGPAIVDGSAHTSGPVPNEIGSTVSIARSEVYHDPAVGCASGLHVGTHDYAKHWAQGALLTVSVNPRDVVSVPTDCNAQKLRCCRYTVLDVIDDPITDPYYDEDEYEDW